MNNSSAPGSMDGKVCVITGATSGIGREAAFGLAAMGATLLLVGRDTARGAAVVETIKARSSRGGAAFVAADLSSQASIRQLAAQIIDRHPRIDVLINNAGGVSATRQLTVDGIEQTFAVNHLAPFLLTQLLREVLIASAPARILTVSSEAHRMLKTLDFENLQGEKRYKSIAAYAVSKLANVLFTYELARRLAGSDVTANCMHPGVVKTGIWQETQGLLRLVVMLAKPFMLSSERAARAVVRLSSDPQYAGVTGRYFIKDREVRSSALSYDEGAARELWRVSEALIR